MEELHEKNCKDKLVMQNLKAKLQEKIDQEAIFEEQKKKAKAFMLQ